MRRMQHDPLLPCNGATTPGPVPVGPGDEPCALPARVLPLAHVQLDVVATSMDAVFEAVARVVAGPQRPTARQVVQRLTSRHGRSSPALGQGLALPHAAVPVIRSPLAVYLRLRTPVRLVKTDEHPVTDCLALLAPTPGFLADHELLMRVMAFLRAPGTDAALRACTDAAAIRQLLTGRV